MSTPIAAAPASPDDHPYLIVPPFDFSGVDTRFLHLVGGLRHELIAKLVRFREWSVLDGASSPVDASSLPGRSFSIEATLRQVSANLSLTLTVKDQPIGRYLWSESFAIEPERWFEVEPSLLRRVAMAVNVHLTAERLGKNARLSDFSLGVYERWLRGQKVLNNFTPDDDLRSASIFESIIEDVPTFSPAYSSLAQRLNSRHLSFPGLRRSATDAVEALRCATKAVQIDPFDSRAHLAHGWALALNQQWDRAELSMDLALKLNENDPWTLTSGALALAFGGKPEAAIELAGQSLALIPQPPPVHCAYQATLRFICEDYAGAADFADRAEGAISNIPAWHAAALVHLGERAKARERAAFFLRTMRAHWHADDATDAAIVAWFLSAFPIRLKADRDRLGDSLALALSY